MEKLFDRLKNIEDMLSRVESIMFLMDNRLAGIEADVASLKDNMDGKNREGVLCFPMRPIDLD